MKNLYLYPEHYQRLVNQIIWDYPSSQYPVSQIIYSTMSNAYFFYWMTLCPSRVAELEKIFLLFQYDRSLQENRFAAMRFFKEILESKGRTQGNQPFFSIENILDMTDQLLGLAANKSEIFQRLQDALETKKIFIADFFPQYDFLTAQQYSNFFQSTLSHHIKYLIEHMPQDRAKLVDAVELILKKAASQYTLFLMQKITEFSIEEKEFFFREEKNHFDLYFEIFTTPSPFFYHFWKSIFRRTDEGVISSGPIAMPEKSMISLNLIRFLDISTQDAQRFLAFFSDYQLLNIYQSLPLYSNPQERVNLVYYLAVYQDRLRQIRCFEPVERYHYPPVFFVFAACRAQSKLNHPLKLSLINQDNEQYFSHYLRAYQGKPLEKNFLLKIVKYALDYQLLYLLWTVLTSFKDRLDLCDKQLFHKKNLHQLLSACYSPEMIFDLFLIAKNPLLKLEDCWRQALNLNHKHLLELVIFHLFDQEQMVKDKMYLKNVEKTIALASSSLLINKNVLSGLLLLLSKPLLDMHRINLERQIFVLLKKIFSNPHSVLQTLDMRFLTFRLKIHAADNTLIEYIQKHLAVFTMNHQLSAHKIFEIYGAEDPAALEKRPIYQQVYWHALDIFLKTGHLDYFHELFKMATQKRSSKTAMILRDFFKDFSSCSLQQIKGIFVDLNINILTSRLLHLVYLYDCAFQGVFKEIEPVLYDTLKERLNEMISENEFSFFDSPNYTRECLIYLVFFSDSELTHQMLAKMLFLPRVGSMLSLMTQHGTICLYLKPFYYEILFKVTGLLKENPFMSNQDIVANLEAFFVSNSIYIKLIQLNKIQPETIAMMIQQFISDYQDWEREVSSQGLDNEWLQNFFAQDEDKDSVDLLLFSSSQDEENGESLSLLGKKRKTML